MPKSHSEIGAADLVPRGKGQGYGREQVARRREWLAARIGASFGHTAASSFDTELMRGNIENTIGVAQVPLGVAGPLLVRGRHAQGVFYVPMATTEGVLVRSYERGMMALSKAGGVAAAVHEDENNISPAYFFDDIPQAAEFAIWIAGRFNELRDAAATTTTHGKLTSVKSYPVGRKVILNLGFDTADAQGMNMIVKAAGAIAGWIKENYAVRHHQIFSGMSSEKRASGFVMTRGKGKRVTAGASIPRGVLEAYLHVTPAQMLELWRTTAAGHFHAASIGHNAHIANGLAAFFIATGQDVATIVHSACGLTEMEPDGDGLFASITLPALTIATVGGGTALPTQREALETLGCFGPGKASKLAEIFAAALLAGDISMSAAIASGEFIAAHEQYGRNRPT
jgi:hydroxymethylglutaryl-CoA reductase (NADPH)